MGAKMVIKLDFQLLILMLGFNPTFKTLSKVSLEVNIFDFDEDVYGKVITIAFIKKIRAEKKFESVNKLIEQLNKDKQYITTHVK